LRHLLLPLTGLVIIVYVLYEMPLAAKQLGAAWVLLGIVYYVVLALRGVSAMTDGKRIDC
jgi:hypothetical protein